VLHPRAPELPPQPSQPITLADLPKDCRAVLAAPDAKP
jgi:penicillin-insensitive murein DD-endopeptidase